MNSVRLRGSQVLRKSILEANTWRTSGCRPDPYQSGSYFSKQYYQTLVVGSNPYIFEEERGSLSIPKLDFIKSWRGPKGVLLSPKRSYASRRYTRQERIYEAKYLSHSYLDRIDNEFEIFTRNVIKVVDLGSAPGTWLNYIRNTLSYLHEVKPDKIYQKCTVIGVDLLFCQPPRGTFYTQGNIYSQNTHTQIEQLLKEAEYKRNRIATDGSDFLVTDEYLSYISRELQEVQLEASLEKREKKASTCSYTFQADLILSDLGPPPLQEVGFHNNTISKPFIRSSQNPVLRQPWDDPEKSSIDMAEAALLLCCTALTKNGNFVVRLPSVDLSDPELMLLESRLSSVFHHVSRWSDNGRVVSNVPRRQHLFMICQGKKDHICDKYDVFGV